MPATGTINYKSILVKANFPEDRWVVAADLRPGNAQAVHHAGHCPAAGIGMHEGRRARRRLRTTSVGMQGKEAPETLGKFNPGLGAQDFSSSNRRSSCRRDRTSSSTCTTPRSARRRPIVPGSAWSSRRSRRASLLRCTTAPPRPTSPFRRSDSNAEVVSEMTATCDTQLVYLQPHMHLRGKDYEVRLIFPSGKTETIFKAKWDFNWQLGFDLEKPIAVPERHAHRRHRAFRQFRQQQVQSRSEQAGGLGRPELGRDAELLHGLPDRSDDDAARLFSPSGPSLLPRGHSGPTLSALQQH